MDAFEYTLLVAAALVGATLAATRGKWGAAAMAARLPGFDHRAVGAAMACTLDRTFTVWQKAAAT